MFCATCLATCQSATLQLHGKWCYTRQWFVQLVSQRLTLLRCTQLHESWCYTRQCFVQLVSQRLNLLRCSYVESGVTLGNVLCNLSRNSSICYIAITWKVPWCYNTRKQNNCYRVVAWTILEQHCCS